MTTDMAQAVDGCTYVIEAIPELLEPKQDLLARLQAAAPGAGHRQQHRQLHHGHARRGAAPPGQPHRHPLLQPRAHHPARGDAPRQRLLRRHLRRDQAPPRGLGQEDGARARRAARLHRQPPHGRARARDRLPARRRHRDAGGPGCRRQGEHRVPVRLPGPDGGRGHDRPRHRRDRLGPRLQGSLQRHRAVARCCSTRSRRASSGSSRARAGTTTAAGRARKSSGRRTRKLLPQLKLFLEAQQASGRAPWPLSLRKELRCSI